MIQSLLAALAAVATLLSGLKASGVNVGPIGDEALKVIDATEVDIANYANGQAVVLGHFSEGGAPGTIVAVKNGGAAASALGL